MTQSIKRAFPRLKGDNPPKEALEFVEEPGKIVGGGKKEGDGVDKGVVPLASRANEKAASKVMICRLVANKVSLKRGSSVGRPEN